MTSPIDPVPDEPTSDDATQSIPAAATQALPSQTAAQAATTGEVLSSEGTPQAPAGPDTPAKRSRRGLYVGAGVLAVALIGGGAAAAAFTLNGGGAQPDEIVPATAIAYVGVDLDPSAGQKVQALLFLRKFPKVKDSLGSDDIGKSLFQAVSKSGDVAGDWDKDVKPWLGKRAAFALLPPAAKGEDPEPLLVLAITDKDAAKAGLAKVSKGELRCDFTDDFAVCGEHQFAAEEVVKANGKNSLSDSKAFKEDLDAAGERGIASAWFNVDKFQDIAASMDKTNKMAAARTDVTGTVAMNVRFDGASLVASGAGHTNKALPLKGAVDLSTLPAGPGVVAAISDGQTWFGTLFTEMHKAVDQQGGGDEWDSTVAQVEDGLGIKLPQDVQKAMGSQVSLSVGDLSASMPEVALRVSGDRAALDKIVNGVKEAVGPSAPLVTVPAGSGTVLASSQSFADSVAKNNGLAAEPTFQQALPGAKGAQSLLYVDLTKILSPTMLDQMDVSSQVRANLAPLKAVGMVGSASGNKSTFELRLTTK